MSKILKFLSITLVVFAFLVVGVGCMKPFLPNVEIVSQYSDVELRNLADSADEKTLIEDWGKPIIAGNERLWPVELDGQTKYIVAYVENGDVISVNVSKTIFITVVMEQNGVMYCTFGWDNYSSDGRNLAFIPNEDCFGNKIECTVGDQILFETDGMVAESYPAQLSKPYSVRIMGQLSGTEVQEIADRIQLP